MAMSTNVGFVSLTSGFGRSTRMYIFTVLTCVVLFLSCITGDVARPRGVAISKASFYQVGDTFTCLDGSETIPFEQVNDDFCDCRDASDEPGTAACPNGSFHCTNSGHRPANIPSSRVNDGICDCCDGTDEYLHPECDNTCRELGRVAREEAERQRLLVEEGHKIYVEYCQQGQEALKDKQIRKDQLEAEKSELQKFRDDLEVIKNEAERPEKEAKERHQKAWEELKKSQDDEKEKSKLMKAFIELDTNYDRKLSVAEMQDHQEFDIDSNGEVSVEEAKEYLEDHDEVEVAYFESDVWPNIKDIYKEPVSDTPEEEHTEPEILPPSTDTPPTGELDEHYYDEDEDEDDYDEEPPRFPRGDLDDLDAYDDEYDDEYDGYEAPEPPAPVEPGMPEYDDDVKALIEIADKAREQFNDADKKFRDVEKEMNDLDKALGYDFGPNKEFYPLKDQCFEFTDLQYTYKLCPFEKTTQRGKSGGSETSLGRWGHWDGPEDNHYSVMKFEKGQNCWNGPDRSCKVITACGTTNELISAAEPNRCEYEFHFRSPSACSQQTPPGEKTHDIHEEL